MIDRKWGPPALVSVRSATAIHTAPPTDRGCEVAYESCKPTPRGSAFRTENFCEAMTLHYTTKQTDMSQGDCTLETRMAC